MARKAAPSAGSHGTFNQGRALLKCPVQGVMSPANSNTEQPFVEGVRPSQLALRRGLWAESLFVHGLVHPWSMCTFCIKAIKWLA
jgi:hypothetical protein